MKNRVTFALAALFSAAFTFARAASPAATQAWVTNYVASTGGGGLSQEAGQQIINHLPQDEEFHIDDYGRTYIKNIELRGGCITTVCYRVSFSVVTNSPAVPYPGARVISSTDPLLPVGTLLADDWTYLRDASNRVNFCVSEQLKTDDHGSYTNYYVSPFQSGDEISGSCYGQDLTITHSIDGTNYVFTIRGYGLFTSTAESILNKTNLTIRGGSWWKKSGETECNVSIMLSVGEEYDPTKPLVAFYHPARFSLFSFLVPSAFAAETVPVISSIPLLSKPACDMVDSFVYAPDGVTSETHWADPETVEDQDQWNDPARWLAEPPPFKITVQVTQPSGMVVEKSMTIRTIEKLLTLVSLPPRAWKAPTFEERTKDCEKGHIYGENCACIVCGVKRDHAWGAVSGSSCYKCVNYFDNYTTDRHGVKIPTGETTSEQCLESCTESNEGYHGGWTATEVAGTDDYSCDCECGFFNEANNKHAHNYADESSITEWEDVGDGSHHCAVLECSRSCGAEKEVVKNHEIKDVQQLPEGVTRQYRELATGSEDWADYHLTQGKCDANGCNYYGWIQEGHSFTLDDPCYCTKCEKYYHKRITKVCGKYNNSICSRCEATYAYEPGVSDGNHDFSRPTQDPYDETHSCVCGFAQHYHYFDNSRTCVGGLDSKGDTTTVVGDNGCGSKKESESNDEGHACALGKAIGKGDDHSSHQNTYGNYGPGGGCECGATLSSVKPGYDPSKPAQGLLMAKGAHYAIGGNGAEVVEWTDGRVYDVYTFGQVGSQVYYKLLLNGRIETMPSWYGPGLHTNVYYDIVYDAEGTLLEDPNGDKYIKW